jgi:glycosidase
MQWDPNENAGFTPSGNQPWLPVNENYREVNASSEMEQPQSIVNIYRRLLHIRRDYSSLQSGSIEIIERDRKYPHLLAYKRKHNEYALLVLINFGDNRCAFVNDSGFEQVILKIGEINTNGNRDIEVGPLSAVILTN